MHEPLSRSFLYVPAHRRRMLDKALASQTGADAVIVDLEDGVPADQRDEAERNMASYATAPAAAPPVLCRIRSGSASRSEDLALTPAWFDGVLLAKAEHPDDVQAVAQTVQQRGDRLALWLLIETARGVENLGELLRGAAIAGVMLGAGDLRADVGLSTTDDERELDYPRSRLVFAARAAGVRNVVDTPDAEIEATERFTTSVKRARSLGFTGKAAIHPAQVAAIHDAYSYSDSERRWARAVLDADDGAQRVGGQMVDEATKRFARRILATAADEAGRHTDGDL